MNLVVSTVNVDTGLQWENNLNASLTILDAHDHTPGNGVPIGSSGLNINGDLPLNGNNLTLARSLNMQVQPAALSLPSDLGCLYVSGVDLYFNDENGNQIKMTAGGTVNATSSGISSGTATASFVSSVLVVNAASNTPANIQVGSVLLGNNVAASKFLTISPPSAMAANYSLTLPALPAVSGNIMTMDTSGNMSAVTNVDNSTLQISSNVMSVKTQGIAQSNLAARSTGTTVGAGGVAVSTSSGGFTTASASYVDITNLSITITTTGRPVMIMVVSDGSASTSLIQALGGSVALGIFQLLRGATVISNQEVGYNMTGVSSGSFIVPSATLSLLDVVAAGTYTYKYQVKLVTGTIIGISVAKLIAYEL